MLRYIVRRIILAIPVLLGVSILAFLVISAAPGDFLDQYRLNPSISKEKVEQMEKQFGFDKSVVVQYFNWLGQVVQGNFGYSFTYRIPVFNLIWGRLAATLALSISTMIFAWGIGIPLGIYSALHKYSFGDQTISFIAFIGISIPNFFFALLWLFMSAKTGWFPIGGYISTNFNDLSFFGKVGDLIWHLIGPMVTLGTASLAGIMRQMRGQLLDNLKMDFVTFARAKGMPERNVIRKHAIRNAINPIITMIGYTLAGLLGGAVLTESVFSWPGMGRLVIDALRQQDLFLVMASLLLSSLMLIIGNLIADILLAWVDPRIRFRLS